MLVSILICGIPICQASMASATSLSTLAYLHAADGLDKGASGNCDESFCHLFAYCYMFHDPGLSDQQAVQWKFLSHAYSLLHVACFRCF